MNVLMVAAENGALPGGKVGGMGDVIRDLPAALAAKGCRVTVLTPGYQHFSLQPGAQRLVEVVTPFRQGREAVVLWRLADDPRRPGVTQLVLEHPGFAPCGAGRIYCDDPPERPFATDASKFALFCRAVLECLLAGHVSRPDVVHLHDWHSALLALLVRFDPACGKLAGLRYVYTIHNLALQGIRPLDHDESSLRAWYPDLSWDHEAIVDPRYGDCFNPMRAGIRLCDKVHAVSPTYAREIQHSAGEGLQADLREAAGAGRLAGILNGCEYPAAVGRAPGFRRLLRLVQAELARWAEDAPHASHQLARRKVAALLQAQSVRPAPLVTSVGRLTDQKVRLLQAPLSAGRSAIDVLLDRLGPDGLLLMLGSGDPALEQFFTEISARRDNFLFLCGFSEALSEPIYRSGQLFLMPSSFEPCGISQMLAMRAGQPCLVHAVGGLADTVQDGVTGFCFGGDGEQQQLEQLLQRFAEALQLHARHPKQWQALRKRAAAQRFRWDDVARDYMDLLYRQ
ncbi:glycogen synthase [Kineobactrum salinum]|uniref:starch synthase n=1 Tax=Kineobactrum salinum TaxID=2708301 RepID=A0A6C0U6W0_9GAMM|nr:glycogen/starch synthase [Kineobactrum salinum]QIB65194.1 glycogen synthase [Kineobactrum salinum]